MSCGRATGQAVELLIAVLGSMRSASRSPSPPIALHVLKITSTVSIFRYLPPPQTWRLVTSPTRFVVQRSTLNSAVLSGHSHRLVSMVSEGHAYDRPSPDSRHTLGHRSKCASPQGCTGSFVARHHRDSFRINVYSRPVMSLLRRFSDGAVRMFGGSINSIG
ncbi:hypothetical protein B0H12DRAFT_1242381 [Mycena haematopus]|nr:hypothetical protein B0H12DRAFT_1242381 [Mycena haematopus]